MLWYGMYGNLPTDKTSKKLAKFQNDLEFQNTFTLLLNIVLDQMKWNNLPETCDARFMEMALVFRGFSAFYKDKNDIIWSYSAGPGGRLTKYGYPSNGYLYALDGTTETCKFYWPFMDNTDADGVLCMDNKMNYPLINYIIRGAQRIADAKRALDVAANNSKRPYIFTGTEEQVKSLESIYNDISNNSPFLIVNESSIDSLKPVILNTNVHEGLIKELWDYYKNTFNDVLQTLGVQVNDNNDKKERMTTGEVAGNINYIIRTLDHRLEERKKFCDRVNEAFGLNISVEYKNDIMIDLSQLTNQEGENNEQDIQNNN